MHAALGGTRLSRWTCAVARALERAAIPLLLIAVICGAALLQGCASDRYLTEEQDAELRKVCEAQGCTMVPTPLWQQIEAWLKAMSRGQGL